jgi:hypothetical protein
MNLPDRRLNVVIERDGDAVNILRPGFERRRLNTATRIPGCWISRIPRPNRRGPGPRRICNIDGGGGWRGGTGALDPNFIGGGEAAYSLHTLKDHVPALFRGEIHRFGFLPIAPSPRPGRDLGPPLAWIS